MGTRFELFLRGGDPQHLEAVAVAAMGEIERLDRLLSRFDSRSEIARINRQAGSRPVRVDREIFSLLERCERARQETEGYFDVTASSSSGGRALSLLLDASSCEVQFARPDLHIDLGGIGKGYALDCARDILLRFGVTRALLHGGTSSVLALNAPEDSDGWPIDVRHPGLCEAEFLTRLELNGRALSCSAVRHRDQQQSDVFDPITGRPLIGDAACVVLAASATEAEIFSTALLAMGRAAALRYLAQQRHPALRVGWFEPGSQGVWVNT